MAPRRYTDVSPEEAERLKKQRDRMRLYRAKIKEKQKEMKETHSNLGLPSTTQRQQNFKLPIPALPRSASTTVKSPSSKAAQWSSELEIVRVHEAHELMKAWQAAPDYTPVDSVYDRTFKESAEREELRRLQQRERQKKCRIKNKEEYGRDAETTTAAGNGDTQSNWDKDTDEIQKSKKCRIKIKEEYGRDADGVAEAAMVAGNDECQSNWDMETDEIQIVDSNEENETNHKILRSYLQKAREGKSADNGHHHHFHPLLEAPPVMCEYFDSPNEKMLPKRRRGVKVGYHEQIEPNVTLLEASDGTLVPLRVLNQGYQDFDDLMEIELVEMGNLDKQTQTADSCDKDLNAMQEENEALKLDNEKLKLENAGLQQENERLKKENERLKQENEKLELELEKLTNKPKPIESES